MMGLVGPVSLVGTHPVLDPGLVGLVGLVGFVSLCGLVGLVGMGYGAKLGQFWVFSCHLN